MCLTCGCKDAHKKMGTNITYEELRDMAVENGQTVDEALRGPGGDGRRSTAPNTSRSTPGSGRPAAADTLTSATPHPDARGGASAAPATGAAPSTGSTDVGDGLLQGSLSDADPGIVRRGTGRGFTYLSPAGRPIRDHEVSPASGPWPSRRRGATCGSAPIHAATCRPSAGTPTEGSSRAITRASAPSVTSSSSTASRRSDGPCRPSAGGWIATFVAPACHGSGSSRRSSPCLRRRTCGSATRSTPGRTGRSA